MTLRLKDPLDIVFNDADWVFEFAFDLTDEEAPAWTASQFELAFAGLGADMAGFRLTTEAGGLVANGPDRVEIRLPAVEVLEIPVGDYEWTLRRLGDDGVTEGLLIGRQAIREGVSRRAGSTVVGSGAAVTGVASGLKIIRAANGVRVARATTGPRGREGEQAPSIADLVAFDDAMTYLDADNVQDALVNLFDLVTAGGTGDLDFSNPNNSALIGVL